MWPWEHLASGYIVYSLVNRAVGGERPTGAEATALAVGTQFPDLIDKPLGWGTSILPSGISLAHSLLCAVPVSLTAIALARYLGVRKVGLAFAVGYLAHLPGDIVYPMVLGGEPRLAFLLWPLLETPASAPASITGHVWGLFAQFLDLLGTPTGRLYAVAELLVLGTALGAWLLDGRPLFPGRR